MDQGFLNTAIKAQYPLLSNSDSETTVMDEAVLLKHLRALQQEGIDGFSIVSILSDMEKDLVLPEKHHALLEFLESICCRILQSIEFPNEISRQFMGAIACLMRIAISDGILSLSRGHLVLKILEDLIEMTIGLADLHGKQETAVRHKLSVSLTGLAILTEQVGGESHMQNARDNLLTMLSEDILAFSEKEQAQMNRLEQRLIDAEAGQLKIVMTRKLAAEMLNRQMANKLLPAMIVHFLHGAWFDSLQLILMREGVRSQAWLRATKLTETLIMTLQPLDSSVSVAEPVVEAVQIEEEIKAFVAEEAGTGNDKPKATPNKELPGFKQKQELYRIIEHLPAELKQCLVSLEHDQQSAEDELAAVEAAHIDVMSGKSLECEPFNLIELEEGLLSENTTVSQSLLAPIENLESGQWFVISEEKKPARHIRLTLKIDELRQVLFTGRNGARVLQVSFDELAYLLGSETIYKMPQKGAMSKTLRAELKKLAKNQVQKEKLEQRQIRRRKVEKRKRNTEEKKVTTLVQGKDSPDKQDENSASPQARTLVSTLEPGAVVKLMMASGDEIEARLAVDSTTEDKLIFVDRSGLNLGEYTKEEFADLLTGGECQIVHNGKEGTDRFRQVIEHLRDKKGLE